MTPHSDASPDLKSDPARGPVRPIVFLHIPKTAGTTLKSVLEQAYAGYEIVFLRNFGGEIEAFARRPAAERAKYALATAHIPWGGQSLIPKARPLTMLRDPVERFLSVYYYNARAPEALHHKAISEGGLSLADVVERGLLAGEYNLMTAMLRHPKAEGGRQAFESAKQNLAQCVFGLSERFEDSVGLFRRALRWPEVAWESRNVSVGRPKSEQIDPALLDRIRRETELDRALYEFGAGLFESRLKEGR
ncbi:MAG: sulfotransferase family 2 domain-containing protein [Phycisphaeraceae bacterium]|nr:MAG: sulfotransferase family 2 domain-containing protein [Phycisphaeraceae bacterium]